MENSSMNQENINLKNMILNNLEQNGFPDKKVSLPLEKMYEVAEKKSANLNTILEELSNEGTLHEKTNDKIIFSQAKSDSPLNEDMMAQAQEMMGNMSEEEIQNIQNMVKGMSPEQQQEMMKKAQDMGII
jgi:hypothetical protein